MVRRLIRAAKPANPRKMRPVERLRAWERIGELKEEAENQRRAAAMDRALMRNAVRRAEKAESELAWARKVAGQMSILFPATTEPMRMAAAPQVQFSVPLQELSPFDLNPTARSTVQSLKVILPRVSRDALRSAVHADLVFDGKVLRYGIADTALASIPRADLPAYLERYVARELVEEFVRGMR